MQLRRRSRSRSDGARRGSRHQSRGQSLVELVVFLPVLLLILVIAVDFGRVYVGLVGVHNMARIGANYAALNASAWDAPDDSVKAARRARYVELMMADAGQINCTLPSPLPAPVFSGFSFASTVRVDIDCRFGMITPLLTDLIGGPDGRVPMSAGTTFTVRTGDINGVAVGGSGTLPSAAPTVTPPPTPTPTPPPTPSPTPDPDASPGPTAEPDPTPEPVEIGFYGTPTSQDSEGGGAPGSPNEDLIVGIPTLAVTFRNTTIGTMGTCLWNFGDGTTSSSCGNTVNKSYSTRGTYHVTLTVNGQQLVRPGYVLVGCKVPSLSGVRINSATGTGGVWGLYGFNASNITTLPGSGNYLIGFQSLAGGMLNPPGGCAGATITVGP